MRQRLQRAVIQLAAAALVFAYVLQPGLAHAAPTPDWPFAGQNAQNTRDAAAETTIGSGNASRLAPAWTVTTAGNVSATPTESGGIVYFPDFGGQLWAVSAATGAVVWKHPVSGYTGVSGDSSRTSPAVSGSEIVFGDGSNYSTTTSGAFIVAGDRTTGQRLWATQVDTHPAAMITSSPVISGSVVYVGVSSKEETLAAAPAYPCCTFRGSVVALDAGTGRILWQTRTQPDNGGHTGGYSGGSVWGSTPAVNTAASLVYVGTGNNYTVPSGVCSTPGETGCAPPAPDDHADSILALDMGTGAIRWATSTLSGDAWSTACGVPSTLQCGPDFDFGSGPNLYTTPAGRLLLGIGQKSGAYWALDPLTGSVAWETVVGPGSAFGGMEWGSATDGRRIYAAIGNLDGTSYTITSASGQRTTTSGGSWAALDAATGALLWQVADPQGAMDLGFVSTANGVVYAGSTAVTGNDMYALDAATGTILWAFPSGGSVVSGAAIVNGLVYWGSGFVVGSACPGVAVTTQRCAFGTGNNDKVYAFAPSG
jgi:polyvinyl alcohol dehydrogenase (cytochrome)